MKKSKKIPLKKINASRLKERILTADFGKLFRRVILTGLCVVLLGTGISTALLWPQINQVTDLMENSQQQEYRADQQQEDQTKATTQHGDFCSGEEEDGGDYETVLIQGIEKIQEPSDAAVASVGITALLCGILLVVLYALIAAWLFKAATLAGMNSLFWVLLGLCGTIFAIVLFLLVRSFFCEKCPVCGAWQKKALAFCQSCGVIVERRCPSCNNICRHDARFCPSCGKKLDPKPDPDPEDEHDAEFAQ